MLRTKIQSLEVKYRKALDELTKIGAGLSTLDEKMGIQTIKSRVLKECPLWDRLDPTMRDRSANLPPFGGGGEIRKNVSTRTAFFWSGGRSGL